MLYTFLIVIMTQILNGWEETESQTSSIVVLFTTFSIVREKFGIYSYSTSNDTLECVMEFRKSNNCNIDYHLMIETTNSNFGKSKLFLLSIKLGSFKAVYQLLTVNTINTIQ